MAVSQSGVPLFGRIYDLQFSTPTKNINLSNLQFTFQTTAYCNGIPKKLNLRIWNPLPTTLLPIQNEGAQIVLQAGYKGQYGPIFSGQVIQVRTGRENGCDTYCDITAYDGDIFYTQGFISTTLGPQYTSVENRIFNVVANTQTPTPMSIDMDDIIIDTSTSTNNMLPRGRVYFGLAKHHLRDITKSVGATFEIENNTQVKVTGENQAKNIAIPNLNYKTGMILPIQQTIEGIQVRLLMNPFLVQGMLVNMNSQAIAKLEAPIVQGSTSPNEGTITQITNITKDGLYKILKVEHNGDTRGLDWTTTIICYNGYSFPAQVPYLPDQYISQT